MNRKYPAKTRLRPATVIPLTGLALAACLAPVDVSADFDNLNQGLRIQQQKSGFQLTLEQVQESARQRAAARPASTGRVGASAPADLGDWTESLRLEPRSAVGPAPGQTAKKSERRLRARQAYERKQRRILDERQRRDALVAGSRSRDPGGIDDFSAKRRNLVRYRTQNQRLYLQRKLRR